MAKKALARVAGGVVLEIIEEHDDIEAEWHPEFIAACVDITDLDPRPADGWLYEGGVFSAPAAFVPSPARRMAIALADGCQIVSTGTPALSATYDADGPRWRQMLDELTYVAAFDAFSGGLSELDWPAKSGEVVIATTAQLKTIARAIGDWQTRWQRFVDSKTADPPTLPVTVA